MAKRVTFWAGAFLLIVVDLGYAYRAYRLHAITAALATPNGINEGLFVGIGGIEQWVTIRGQDRHNPLLLLLHGGPGNAFQSFTRAAFSEWERVFTVVQWDQRGDGRTFGRSGPVDNTMTLDRMVLDASAVAEFAGRKVGQNKVILLGLAWGSILGVRLAKARPDLLYAYVGTGQVVNYRAGKVQAYAQLLVEAHARQDNQAIQELEAIGSPPYDSTSKSAVYTRWANRYEPSMPSRRTMLSMVFFESDASVGDLRNLMPGIRSSEDHFRTMMDSMDLPTLGTDFNVPIFVFQGAADNVAPVAQIRTYINSIHAPRKELVLMQDAGHNAIVTKNDEFL
jgi:pimeloyl-ACP methyl ester carboxylesterase